MKANQQIKSDLTFTPPPPAPITEGAKNDRRKFLQLAGAALLGTAALPNSAQAVVQTGPFETGKTYGIGVVTNPSLPGLSGELFLTVYVVVSEDGTGIGTLSDPVHAAVNCHLAIHRTASHGNELLFEGEVIRSNTPAQVGLAFAVAGVLENEFTDLRLQFNAQTFNGQGFVIKGNHIGIFK